MGLGPLPQALCCSVAHMRKLSAAALASASEAPGARKICRKTSRKIFRACCPPQEYALLKSSVSRLTSTRAISHHSLHRGSENHSVEDVLFTGPEAERLDRISGIRCQRPQQR
jgi:hypothetical protein